MDVPAGWEHAEGDVAAGSRHTGSEWWQGGGAACRRGGLSDAVVAGVPGAGFPVQDDSRLADDDRSPGGG